MTHKVFVYGTLKRNEPNHYWLTDKQNGESCFVGNGVTTKQYPLVIATHFNIPFLLHVPGTGHFVKGDVYEVDDHMLSRLDVLEEHPDYYERELDDIKIIDKQNQEQIIRCWVYFLKRYKQSMLKLPMLETYSSSGAHGKPYVDRSRRDITYMHELNELKAKPRL